MASEISWYFAPLERETEPEDDEPDGEGAQDTEEDGEGAGADKQLLSVFHYCEFGLQLSDII